ncbi:MAG: MotA/TolQ/ExbB proton channel family protein [Myxococcales bacterium]|nr:MotA/TolQ/ExbB proton channel family protein [Myxococcales bacterium]MCB9718313.1 MotA/TolQ/ExbB proton channel family protein [Myxococcales bacterium]
MAPQFPALVGSSTPGSLLADVDLVPLLTSSQGIVLGVVIILLLLVALCIFVIFYKLVHITQAQGQSITFLDRFWESKRLDEIYQVAEKLKRSPIAAMFRAGYVELSKVKRSRGGGGQMGMEAQVSMHERAGDADNVERALARARLSENTKLENLLPFLATTGSAAPFIGLFGTVWGIMDAFLSIAAKGSAELGEVSQPIAEALVTTALALASAVPAVVAYNYFQRRLKVLNAEMTNFSSDFMNIVKRHFF